MTARPRRRRIDLLIGVLLAVAVVCVAACGSAAPRPGASDDTDGADGTIEIVDSAGRTVRLETPVERVAVLDRGTAEVMRALGVLDRMVGGHESYIGDPFWEELQDVPVVATWSEVNFEAVAEVQPDLVIAGLGHGHGIVEDSEHLDALGIPYAAFSLRSPDEIDQEILTLGRVFGAEDRAQDLVGFYGRVTGEIRRRLSRVPTEDWPRVFVETHAGELTTGGPGSRFYAQVELAGGTNIASGIDGERQVDAEFIAQADPEVIIREGSSLGYGVDSMQQSDAEEIREQLAATPGVAQTSAARNGRILVLPIDVYSRPGWIVGVAYMATWFHPEQFEGFDPEEIHRDYLERFHPNVPYRGVWAHPDTPPEANNSPGPGE